jgi:phage gpG-like protein
MSVRLVVDDSELDLAIKLINALGEVEPSELMSAVALLGENQTRRRIEEEKTAPDGTPWLPNAEGTSILLRTGMHLRDSVASNSSATEAEWGASWEHAHVHQYGATIVPKDAAALIFTVGGKQVGAKKVTIPPRPFVGLSSENRQEMEELITDMLGLGGFQ